MSKESTALDRLRQLFLVRLPDAFLLREAIALSERLPPEQREAIDRIHRLGLQRVEAAELLWSSGRTADGLRMAADAFAQSLAAVAALGEALGLDPAPESEENSKTEPEGEENSTVPEDSEESSESQPDANEPEANEPEANEPEANEPEANEPAPLSPLLRASLLERGFGEAEVASLAALRARAAGPLPLLDEELEADHGTLLRDLLEAQRALALRLRPAMMRPWALRISRVRRFVGLGLGVALLSVGLYFAVRTPYTMEAAASSTYHDEAVFTPERAFDGNPATEWLAGGQDGWIEARLSPPRDIRTIRVLNGHNRHYNDRAIHRYRIELYRGEEQVKAISGEFPTLTARPEWVAHEESAEGVDRIRLVVLDSHRLGASLAELAWTESE